jgi:hypothetical protein
MRWREKDFWIEGMCPPTRVFFVSADSKGVAEAMLVSADSERLKAAVFSIIWKWLVSADSKRVRKAICILKGILFVSADSTGVRRTTWRASTFVRAAKNLADLAKRL